MGRRNPNDDPNDCLAEFCRHQDMLGDLVQEQVEREEEAERRHELGRDQGVGEIRPSIIRRSNQGRGRG